MKTNLLRLLRRVAWNPRVRLFDLKEGFRGFAVPFSLTCGRRGAGGHSWVLAWDPCWLLTCMWDVRTFTVPPTVRGGEKLRDLLRETLKEPNAHYLPWGGAATLRGILEGITEARNERARESRLVREERNAWASGELGSVYGPEVGA